MEPNSFVEELNNEIRVSVDELTTLESNDSERRDLLMERIKEFTIIAKDYEVAKKNLDSIEARFNLLRRSNFGYVDLPLTEGAFNQSYINCNPALAANLAPNDQRIININLPFESKKTGSNILKSKILSNGYLQDRTILKELTEFYKLHEGDELRWTKLGPTTYSISMTDDYNEEVYGE